MFEMAFHLPFPALRKSAHPNQDARTGADGNPLRKHQDLTYLQWDQVDQAQYLYEAHRSCVLSGMSDQQWDVCCFVDGWFDADDDDRETAETYYECDAPNGGQQVDACMLGKRPVTPLIRNPRQWFTRALQIHLLHVYNEWWKLILALENSLSKYEEVREHKGVTRRPLVVRPMNELPSDSDTGTSATQGST